MESSGGAAGFGLESKPTIFRNFRTKKWLQLRYVHPIALIRPHQGQSRGGELVGRCDYLRYLRGGNCRSMRSPAETLAILDRASSQFSRPLDGGGLGWGRHGNVQCAA